MKKSYLKIVIFSFLLLFSWIFFVGAQDIHEAGDICEKKYEIFGPSKVRIDKVLEYKIILSGGDNVFDSKNIKFKVIKNWKTLLNESNNNLSYTFEEQSEYLIRAEFSDQDKCYFSIEKNIKSYPKAIIYIWDEIKELELGFEENFEKNWILFTKSFISDKKIIWEEDIVTKLSENTLDIKNSDIIIVKSKFFDQIFGVWGKLWNNQQLDLSNKQIFVLSTLNKNFLKRILAKYVKILWISQVYVLGSENFLNFFSSISFGSDVLQEPYIRTFSLDFSQVPKYYLVSYLVDNLIYNWFPINLISLFLALWLAALLVSFFRQVIWFSVFGIYSPIFFATSMAVFWTRFSIILFVIAFLAVLLTRIFTKRVYLLYSAKMTVLIVLYFLLIVVVLGLDKILWTNLIDFAVFNNSLVIFPIIFLIVVADKVFYEWFKIHSKAWLISFVEFILVSSVVYGILSREGLKQILLSYPEFIVIIFILNIFVWRFTGLQVLEYIRFIPLLQKEGDSEIEEE